MKVEITNWGRLHANTKRRLFQLMRQYHSGMRAAIEYHDHHHSHRNYCTSIGRVSSGRIIGWSYACPYLDGMYVMVYVDLNFRKKGYGEAIVCKLLTSYQDKHGPTKFYACCIETKFFQRCGIQYLAGRVPVKLSWRDECGT